MSISVPFILSLAVSVPSLGRPVQSVSREAYKELGMVSPLRGTGPESLASALTELEGKFNVYLNYEAEVCRDNTVEQERLYSYRRSPSVEKALHILLEPHGLQFEKIKSNYYVIFKRDAGLPAREDERKASGPSFDSSPAAPYLQLKIPPGIRERAIRLLQTTITGTVTASDSGEPLPGVSVTLKEAEGTGTSTGADGRYTLNVPGSQPGKTLVFSFIGYVTQEVPLGNREQVDVVMTPDVAALDEVVVVGYGTTKKSDLTGSVSSISAKDITSIPVNDVQQILQGRAPGVQVIQNSHSPGGGLSVRIRGANSIIGGNEPLYVVDGFIGGVGLNSINPNDIETIEILKDASATAIYGARGANGVVIITTKRGAEGRDFVNFDTYYGFQEVARTMDVMNARQFAEIANARVLNDGGTQVPFPDLDNLPYDTDWQDAVFRTAPMQNYSLSFSGGDAKTQYLISANYFDQVGIVENTDFGRGTIRANLDKQIGRLKVSNSFQASRVVENDIPEGQDQGPVAGAISAYPTRPVMEDGEFAQMDIQEYGGFSDPIPNPVAEITQRLRESKTTRVFDMLYGEFEIMEGLKAKVSLGVDYTNRRYDGYTRRTIPGTNVNGVATISNQETINVLNENILYYNKEFNDQSLNALVGFTSQRDEARNFNAGARDFPTDILETGDLNSGAVIDVPGSGGTIWSQQSVLGRINYVWKDKYLVTATGRYDGSSRLAKQNRWTFFPSFALGWRVNQEPFMSGMTGISNLKLRVSWGMTGNDRISSYLSQQRIGSNTLSSGEQIVVGLAPANLPSSDLKWEVTRQTDIGLDLGLLNERLRLTADYYVKNTTDLLALVQLPPTVGYDEVIQNIGELKNTGFELGIGADILAGDVQWSVEANLSANRNEITRLKDGNDVFAANLPGGATAGSFHIMREGETLASYYGYLENGLDETGDITYKDLDGNGVIDAEDRTILGDFFPDFIYGFNTYFSWKGFDLNVFFQGVQGVDLIRLDRFRNANSLTRGYNQLAEVSDYWTPENTDARYPKPRSGINFRGSDAFVEDASYLKLRNIQLGYNIPVANLGATWLRSLKIYASAQNLLTITKYTGYDPEVNNMGNSDLRLGMDLSSYPSARTFTFGVNLGF